MAPLAGISPGLHSSFSSISLSLSIWRSKVVVAVVTLTDLTRPFESGCTSTIRAMFQSFLGARSSTISTRSPFSKFLRGRFHFILCCRFWTYSFLHLDQKTFERHSTRFHLLRRYKSAFWKFPGGGMTTLDFIVNMWFGRCEWIQILGIACWDSEWPTVDDAFHLSQQGSKGLIVEGVAVFSHQSRQNWSLSYGMLSEDSASIG